MRFNCGPTLQEKIAAKEQWHIWFAWFPVRVTPGDCRWLEKVKRKGEYVSWPGDSYFVWEYRTIEQERRP